MDPSLQSRTGPEQMKQAAGDELARRRAALFRNSSTVLGNELLNFRVAKKGSTPDPSQLLRDQDPARYLMIILMETIKDLYKRLQIFDRPPPAPGGVPYAPHLSLASGVTNITTGL
jgi:hypothetical protein